jgi:hypothetical protein
VRFRATCGGLALLLGAFALAVNASAAVPAPPFNSPDAVVSDGAGHLWIANGGNFGITEVDAATGRILRVVHGAQYGFNNPSAIAVSGQNVWVTSEGYERGDGSFSEGVLTQFNSTTGSVHRRMNLAGDGGTGLDGVVVTGPDVWLSARGTAAQIKMDLASGQVVSIFHKNAIVNTQGPSSFVFDGTNLWMTGQKGVVELSPRTGQILHSASVFVMATPPGASYAAPSYLSPVAITFSPGHVWTGNGAGYDGKHSLPGSVSDINPTTDKEVHLFASTHDDFDNIQKIIVVGSDLWVLNGQIGPSQGMQGASLTELDSTTGALVRVVSLRDSPFSEPVDVTMANGAIWVVDNGGESNRNVGYLLEVSPATGAIIRRVS